MNIDLLNNDNLIFGAASVEFSDEMFRFYRMTEELQEFYNSEDKLRIRAYCPSGVRIGFISDTSTLAMEVGYGDFSRSNFNIDVVIDGSEKMTFGPPEKTSRFSFSMEIPPGGERRIEIYLPAMAVCWVKGIDIEDGATLYPLPEYNKRVMFIGDSITQGMVASTPAMTFPAQLSQTMDFDFHNCGVGGATIKGMVGRMVQEFEWDDVIVAYGVNDFSQARQLPSFEEDARLMLNSLCDRDKGCFIITPIPWATRKAPNEIGLYLEDYRQSLRKIAAEFPHFKVIEGTDLVPDDPAFFVDDVHPNDLGMSSYADNLQKQLEQSGSF
ncbi:MAG: SGNH/GDSL hydrolase family protein [Lentisphaerae bacterium]|nr:SGNH/GDSL hydrolase family protein [Lentisphaerota bacterium]MCP4101845.1 SGNH/GDSL hydrolase family protein [Lentisphaerota bacterium]